MGSVCLARMKFWVQSPLPQKTGMVVQVHTYNPSIQQVEAGGLEVPSQASLRLVMSLGYMKVCHPSQTKPKCLSAGVGWALDGWHPRGRSPFHTVSTCIFFHAPWSVTLDLELVDCPAAAGS